MSDVKFVEAAQSGFPDLRAVSFNRSFHSPADRVRIDELLDCSELPKKGYLNKAERARESRGVRRDAPAASCGGVGDQKPRAP